MKFFRRRWLMLGGLALCLSYAHAQNAEKTWYKGNTHAHSLWSDGDAAPETVVEWYKSNGYDFLCLSEHNILADGSVDRWFPITEDGRLTPTKVAALEKRYGHEWVTHDVRHGRSYMRLKTLPELKRRFEEDGQFLLVPGIEITSVLPPVHVNAFNVDDLLPAANFVDTTEGFIANLDFVAQFGQRTGAPTLAHINHPNWQDGYPAEAVIPLDGALIFEVYNGHPGVRNWGGQSRHMVSTDRFWDIVLAMRLKRDKRNTLFGVGVGDSHDYFDFGVGHANPGRGWIMVRANALTPEAIIDAMRRGNFYASSGVELLELEQSSKAIRIRIQPEDGVRYTTQFVGTLRGFDSVSRPARDEAGDIVNSATRVYSDEIGRVLKEVEGQDAVYRLTGDELSVRAKIISSKKQENPFAEGDREMAWLQPVTP